ncbi:MAG: hypothetical protein FJ299_07400 [Planctomycetes bacterium]|nr:hypothetical protein [Planctomycetota bacterium]
MGTQRRRWPRIALALLLGTLFGLALVEVGARVVLRARGTPYDAAAARGRLEALSAGMRAFVPQDAVGERLAAGAALPDLAVLQHPYTGYDVYKGYVEYQRDLAYFLQPSGAGAGGAAGTFDLLLLGGSVAAQFGEAKSGARALVERLSTHPAVAGRPARVFTYARMGFRQPQSCTQLAFLLAAGFQPDAVVLLDGFNDVALGCNNAHNGVSPLFPSTSHWGFLLRHPLSKEGALPLFLSVAEHNARAEALATVALERGYARSALLGPWAVARSLRERSQAVAAQQQVEALSKTGTRSVAETGMGFEGDPAQAVDSAVRCWRESSRSMRALCEARGIVYLHALQPALHDPDGGKVPSADERAGASIDEYWLEGVRLGYPRLREALGVLRAGGEHALDLSGLFRGVEESVYTDYCHLDERGNARVAAALADALASALAAR